MEEYEGSSFEEVLHENEMLTSEDAYGILEDMEPESLPFFLEGLKEYTAADYLEQAPYDYLYECAAHRAARFEQFAVCLRKDAESKQADMDTVNDMIDSARNMAIGAAEHFYNNQMRSIFRLIKDLPEDETKVSVLPLMCGSGKSTTITRLIIDSFPSKDQAPVCKESVVWMHIANELAKATSGDILYPEVTDEIWECQPEYDRLWAEHILKYHSKALMENNDWLIKKIGSLKESEAGLPEYETYEDPGYGLLIVTDSKERMEEYWKYVKIKDNSMFSPEEKEFIAWHQDDVVILTGDSFAESVAKVSHARVLIMTTQRYFDYSTNEQIQEWLHNGAIDRTTVIFDEEPYIRELRDITVGTLNTVSTGIYYAIDDTVEPEDRKWCYEQWEKARSKFYALFYKMENDGLPLQYYKDSLGSVTEDDARFFGIIEEHRLDFLKSRVYSDAYSFLQQLRILCTGFGLFSYRSTKNNDSVFSTQFTVCLDNREKLLNLGSRALILDGTGDISPLYNEDYIVRENGTAFNRDLSFLTVKLVNKSTSTFELLNNGKKISQFVTAYLKQQGEKIEDTVLFTKASAEKRFSGKGFSCTEHFGNIKGKNTYRDKTVFAQVGINRSPLSTYFTHMLAHDESMRQRLEECVGDTEKCLKR